MTKNIFSVKFLSLIIAISSILLVGCDKNEDKKSLDLRIVESQLYFEPTGGEGSIIIEAEPESVISVESSTGWCRFISSEYQDENRYKITIQTIRNAALTARSALLTISDGKTSQDVVATQSGTIFYTDEDYERRFDNKKQQFSIDVFSSLDYDVNLAESWITVTEKADGRVTLELSENKTGLPRATIMSVSTTSGQSTAYAIYQYEASDLLGVFASEAIVKWDYLGIYDQVEVEDAEIIDNGDNTYQINFSLPTNTSKFDYSIKATYDKNALLIEAGQYQPGQNFIESDRMLYSYLVCCSNGGKDMYLLNYRVGFAPIMTQEEDGVYLVYAFKDEDNPSIKSSSYIGMAFFTEEEDPGMDTFLPEYTLLMDLRFYNQVK